MLKLINDSLYTAKYLVTRGNMRGQMIQVIYGTPDLLKRIEGNFKVSDFERDVIGGINVVTDFQGNPVDNYVLNEINKFSHPDISLITGKWTPDDGWVYY